jgi:prolipoprotein diacylglyceryltransferase
MSGKQRRVHCSQNSPLLPAVVCPLDGGVSRHGILLALSTAAATAQRLRQLHATDATDTAAGMGRTADAGLG